MRALLVLLALAGPALAQEPISGEEFEDLVEGRTLTYGEPGQEPYGIEHYFPNRRVTWAFTDSQDCIEGTWYTEGPADAPAICFVYNDDLGPQCWHVFREGEGLRAEFLGDGGPSILYQLEEQKGGLVCGGVGV
ncbi:hypothetical protein [Rubellimicrobium arenae]|uniref:hypothetical protein n=1 Tax=Rubellimicrobium arenae TaxID=2817372 RepID=UPI001B30421C|nr:hypothetical protein [Rubellimicrobium arenae]